MSSPELIAEASAYLKDRVRRTPVEPSPALEELLGVPVSLKLECLQVTGSFKVRGALFHLSRLDESVRQGGVATCSAGNHGKGLAYAAKRLGVRATVYVPSTVDPAKLVGMQRLGATVLRSRFPGYDETEAWARQEARRLGLPFVSAFEDDAIRAGNGGTLARELMEQRPELHNIVVPVSGGGLAAGAACFLRAAHPQVKLWACQHEESPALALSLERGEAVTSLPPIDTLAGGIEGGIGRENFELLRPSLAGVALVSERELWAATRWALEEHQLLVEPSGAAPIAACRTGKLDALDGPTALVLTGRNLSLGGLRRILAG